MIELLWKSFDENVMLFVSNLITWLASTIAQQQTDDDKFEMSGFLVAKNTKGELFTLIFSDEKYQKRILKILQQPPDYYKEKYIACIPSEEPNPVVEKKEDDQNEEQINIADKT